MDENDATCDPDINAVLPLAFGQTRQVHPGVLDEDARAAFLGGQCHALAAALVEVTAWPIACVGRLSCLDIRYKDGVCYDYLPDRLCHCQVEHVGVIDPVGRFIDITGARLIPDLENISTTVRRIPRLVLERILTDPWWPVADLAIARTFVVPVLGLLGLRPGSGGFAMNCP